MKIASVGGGPAGLYFGILMKQADPAHEVVVIERNRPDDTFGFGVVFSDATLENLGRADAASYNQIRGAFARWDDIHVHWRGEMLRSTGHGFCGLERRVLLEILQARCREVGVELRFEEEVRDVDALAREMDLVLAADGVGSAVREARAAALGPSVDVRPNRFVWLGTTFPFEAFTFHFKENDAGLWRVHAYRYKPNGSTFIVECTAETFARSGLAVEDEDATIAYLERLFAEELDGHRLIKNRSIWRSFPTVKNARWSDGNVVLVGDAAHTAHFSIGSGTKLALEDSIALADALAAAKGDVPEALVRYEAERRPAVEGLQRAAQVSLEWFEGTERYRHMPLVQFVFSLMTRSLRVTHAGLARRDPELIEAVDTWFAAAAGAMPRTPALVPFRAGGFTAKNRLVAMHGHGEVVDFAGQPVGMALDAASGLRIARVPSGVEGDAAVAFAREASKGGADAVLVGDLGSNARLGHVALSDRVRNETGVITIVAGGITTLDEVSTVVAAGRADLCVVR